MPACGVASPTRSAGASWQHSRNTGALRTLELLRAQAAGQGGALGSQTPRLVQHQVVRNRQVACGQAGSEREGGQG